MPTDEGTILVTGATGNTASPIVRALADGAAPVRALIHREQDIERLPEGVQASVGDFDEPDSLSAALQSVRSAYLVTPSSERAQQQQLRFVQLAVDAGVGRIVLLSQLGARADSPVRFLRYHAVVEDRIRELGIEYTFLRPNLYYQGLFAFAGSIAQDGSFGAPIGAAAVSAVDVRDIADVAIAALTDDRHIGATYTLTGPRAITHADMAQALSAALGRTISFADASAPDFAAALQGILPPWQIDGLLEDYAHYSRGEAAEVTDAVSTVTGHAPRSFAAFAEDYASRFTT